MKPLVLWCRWHEARLRLHGRDEASVWGELAFADRHEPFRYHHASRQLEIGDTASRRILILDEMGVVLDEKGPG